MKKLFKNASFKITVSILGGFIVGFFVKQASHKPQAGVIVAGDTVLNTGGQPIDTTNTVKLDTTTLK